MYLQDATTFPLPSGEEQEDRDEATGGEVPAKVD
jgi:hypothetical protein